MGGGEGGLVAIDDFIRRADIIIVHMEKEKGGGLSDVALHW